MYLSRNGLIVFGVLLCADLAHAQVNVPVSVPVTPPGGGAAAAQTIGTIAANTGAGGAPPITAVFTLDPQYNWLDDWYDFRWISVITQFVLPGPIAIDTDGDGVADFIHPGGMIDKDGDGNFEILVPLPGGGTVLREMPFIDPQTGQAVPGALPAGTGDDQPYYNNAADWAGSHVEGESSSFFDFKNISVDGSTITFNTYLVLDDITAGGFPDQQFCILAGFSWTWSRNSPPAVPSTIVVAAVPLAANAAAVGQITTALGQANPAFASPAGANPPGAAWTPIKDCTLTGCENFRRCATWPRYAKAYTISSYKYTNYLRGYEWEVVTESNPVEVPAGTGPPVVRYFDVPFDPNDLHLTYSWPNAFIRSHHWKWNFAKGDSFFWRWYCLKIPFSDVFICSDPDPETEPSLCLQEVDCIGGEQCFDPYVLGPDDVVLGDLLGAGGSDFAVVCGNNIREGDEQCDGTDDAACPGNCQPDCTCLPGTIIPTVSEWGLMVMTLLMLTAGTIILGRRRRPAAR